MVETYLSMIKDKTLRLKELIEICESQFFSRKKLKVFILNKRYTKNESASLNINKHLRYKFYIWVVFAFAEYLCTLIRFFSGYLLYVKDKQKTLIRKRSYKSMMLRHLGMVRFHSIYCRKMFYVISTSSHILDIPELTLIEIALHEVRHHVQIEKNYSDSDLKTSSILTKSFKDQYEDFRESVVSNGGYKAEEYFREIDANFIATTYVYLIERELKGSTELDNSFLINFFRGFKHIMTWKTPEPK